MAWLWLLTAGFFEITFAALLKLSDGFTKPIYTSLFIVSAAISLYCLTRAMQTIPIGTAYAVWTGIGAVGAVMLGTLLFGESLSPIRVFFIMLLIISIIGLKFVAE
ncbi:MAG TPA: QacE family quaternary ammonium compound efflux SMR transporter [Colwellia sp.]|jgi:quaternary ammonium compound-resistance protein SugE|nr:QacE family quaternary ammonium compound efflux SMR transporter [Colwellia sp.]